MARAIAHVTLFRDGLLPADQVVNVMHFEDDSGFSTEGGISVNGPGLITRISTFYNAISNTWLSPALTGTGQIKLYDFADAKPRIPRMQSDFTFPLSGTAFPSEVALCISFAAAPVAGLPQSRRRGRIFLGPLQNGYGGRAISDSDVRPTAISMDPMMTAFRTMSRGGAGTFRLAVYSPTTVAQGGTVDDAWNDAETAWADNAYDTMRSRGAKALLRRTVSLGNTAAPT